MARWPISTGRRGRVGSAKKTSLAREVRGPSLAEKRARSKMAPLTGSDHEPSLTRRSAHGYPILAPPELTRPNCFLTPPRPRRPNVPRAFSPDFPDEPLILTQDLRKPPWFSWVFAPFLLF